VFTVDDDVVDLVAAHRGGSDDGGKLT